MRRSRGVLVRGLASTLLLTATPAMLPSAAGAAPVITVAPSSDLVDGQHVAVSGSGYPPDTTVGIIQCGAGAQTAADCQLRFDTTTTDANGAFTNAGFTVSQVINSGNLGILNCAADPCIIAVGTLDQANIAVQPITMVNTLGPPDGTVALTGPFVVDATGRVTATAAVECNVSRDVGLRFQVSQGTKRDTGGVVFPCTSGTTVLAIGDFLGAGYTPGSLDVVATIWTGPYPEHSTATIAVVSQADAEAQLIAELGGPNGAQAYAGLVQALRFRLLYNPKFAHEFYVALFRALAQA